MLSRFVGYPLQSVSYAAAASPPRVAPRSDLNIGKWKTVLTVPVPVVAIRGRRKLF